MRKLTILETSSCGFVQMDKDPGSDREIQDTRSVMLDAVDSDAGGEDQYITDYHWDLDLLVDSDGDGNTENDADLTGESVEWKDVAPGEYQINLSVMNSAGKMDGDKIKVYVSFSTVIGRTVIGKSPVAIPTTQKKYNSICRLYMTKRRAILSEKWS